MVRVNKVVTTLTLRQCRNLRDFVFVLSFLLFLLCSSDVLVLFSVDSVHDARPRRSQCRCIAGKTGLRVFFLVFRFLFRNRAFFWKELIFQEEVVPREPVMTPRVTRQKSKTDAAAAAAVATNYAFSQQNFVKVRGLFMKANRKLDVRIR